MGPDGTARALCPPLDLLPLLRKSFAAHAIFLLLSGGFVLFLAVLALFVAGMSDKVAPHTALIIPLVIGPLSAFMLVLLTYAEIAIYERPQRPTARLGSKLLIRMRDKEAWAAGLPVYVSLCLFMFAFGHSKSSITVLQPFAWDETFDQLDTLLHFGRRPWEWLQPIIGYPVVTFLLNVNYNIWFLVMMGFWTYYAFIVRPCVERTRFFLAFMMIWIIGGSIFAIILSSAGPCYYGAGRLGLDPDPYAGLMDYLRSANRSLPVWALSVQSLLWNELGDTMPFGGVSAMPSMHNATALLFLLTSGRFPRWLRVLLCVHLVLIFIGSVHLAWHYAIDSYLAWAVTLAVWHPAGVMARWWEARPAAKAFTAAVQGRA